MDNHQSDRSLQQLETRPRYQTSQGKEAGELFVRVLVGSQVPSVMVCWAAWTAVKRDYFDHLEFRLDIHANISQSGEYLQAKSRSKWNDAENKETKFKNCAILQNIPIGQHVLGIESKSNEHTLGITHVIMWDKNAN